jgi:hypothetical protein
MYITDRAVFRLADDGIRLEEVADGVGPLAQLSAYRTVDKATLSEFNKVRQGTSITDVRRIFGTNGTITDFDYGILQDPRSYPVWEFCGDAGVSICLQVRAAAFPIRAASILKAGTGRGCGHDGADQHRAVGLGGETQAAADLRQRDVDDIEVDRHDEVRQGQEPDRGRSGAARRGCGVHGWAPLIRSVREFRSLH